MPCLVAAVPVGNEARMDNNQSVVIFTTAGCPFCRKAAAALDDSGVKFYDFQTSASDDLFSVLREETGCQTFPQA